MSSSKIGGRELSRRSRPVVMDISDTYHRNPLRNRENKHQTSLARFRDLSGTSHPLLVEANIHQQQRLARSSNDHSKLQL